VLAIVPIFWPRNVSGSSSAKSTTGHLRATGDIATLGCREDGDEPSKAEPTSTFGHIPWRYQIQCGLGLLHGQGCR